MKYKTCFFFTQFSNRKFGTAKDLKTTDIWNC